MGYTSAQGNTAYVSDAMPAASLNLYTSNDFDFDPACFTELNMLNRSWPGAIWMPPGSGSPPWAARTRRQARWRWRPCCWARARMGAAHRGGSHRAGMDRTHQPAGRSGAGRPLHAAQAAGHARRRPGRRHGIAAPPGSQVRSAGSGLRQQRRLLRRTSRITCRKPRPRRGARSRAACGNQPRWAGYAFCAATPPAGWIC